MIGTRKNKFYYMNNFDIEYNKIKKYSAVVYSASYVNPMDEVASISECIKKCVKGEGLILFDLLLSNGNSYNRFAEAIFNGKEIIKESIHVVERIQNEEYKKIDLHYTNRLQELYNSVLTESEINKYIK